MRTAEIWTILLLPVVVILAVAWFFAPPLPEYAAGDSVQIIHVSNETGPAGGPMRILCRKVIWEARGGLLFPAWSYYASDGEIEGWFSGDSLADSGD